jgi:hypothetical protein
MNKELEKEFSSEVRIVDKLKVVGINNLAHHSFVVKYKHDIVNNGKILFIDDEMNIINVQHSKNIYDRVYINNVRNLLDSMTTKVKCDEFNNILFGTHEAFFNKDKIKYKNRPNGKIDYHAISTDVLRNIKIWIKISELAARLHR